MGGSGTRHEKERPIGDRDRPPSARGPLGLLADVRSLPAEVLLVLVGYVVYSALRIVVEGPFDRASANSERILALERLLGIDGERAAQAWVVDRPRLVAFWNAIYVWLYWPSVGVALLWLFHVDRARYRLLRNALLVSAAIGLVVFAVFPVAPPRFLDGYVDTVAQGGGRVSGRGDELLNLHAAVPSFHVGWPALAGFVVASRVRRAGPALAAFVPAVLLAGAVVFTGNHFVVDVVAGVAVVAGAHALAGRIPAAELGRPPDPWPSGRGSYTRGVTGPILQTVPLGSQWPTLDPFLFCAHHLDRYPAGDGSLAPAAPLTGRNIGMDFAGIDGWNMYHGSTVPGFPQHPHRGFETVTYVRRGWCDHSDSLGAKARFGEGDVQWVTAGGGIVHAEMFPLFDREGPNTLHLFQIWLNLPAASKMVDPYFSMLWHHELPTVGDGLGGDGRGAEVTVLAGRLAGAEAPAPPPDSWAADPANDVAIWHVRLDDGGRVELPAAAPGSNRVLYLFDGSTSVAGQVVGPDTGVVVDPAVAVELAAEAGGSELLMLQGRPIGEPVARYGPFVLNDEAGIRQAMADYQATGFGGWPWPADDPVHGPDPARFALHADGRVEHPDQDPQPQPR